MFCTKCGFDNGDSSVFCGKCGVPLEIAKPGQSSSSAIEIKYPRETGSEKKFGVIPLALIAGGALLLIAALILIIL